MRDGFLRRECPFFVCCLHVLPIHDTIPGAAVGTKSSITTAAMLIPYSYMQHHPESAVCLLERTQAVPSELLSTLQNLFRLGRGSVNSTPKFSLGRKLLSNH
ncbi:hypothetical protein G7K_3710-t1 [Saitoella complicata NRRL Y-17804]|uniref:Uncharacterized protein n=1 Tax=Saitoella complicata (strain BCRC 22490 / CBS 7301 / JCM 7358 / NBRC 10748 / NRRL Y-17804) TaxID=698492 RepID=A0A0E9NIQ7_SAICN|nr:hypothetical protein G7K_3710-t1 [Saitoella complicata NRRL Y-17804]